MNQKIVFSILYEAHFCFPFSLTTFIKSAMHSVRINFSFFPIYPTDVFLSLLVDFGNCTFQLGCRLRWIHSLHQHFACPFLQEHFTEIPITSFFFTRLLTFGSSLVLFSSFLCHRLPKYTKVLRHVRQPMPFRTSQPTTRWSNHLLDGTHVLFSFLPLFVEDSCNHRMSISCPSPRAHFQRDARALAQNSWPERRLRDCRRHLNT